MANRLARRGGQTRRESLPRRVQWLIAGAALAAAGLALVVQQGAVPAHVSHRIPWPLIALALIGAERVPVRFNTEKQSIRLDLYGLPALLGAVFTSPFGLIMAATVAAVADGLLEHKHPLKTAFNVANQVIGVGLALLVLNICLGHAVPVSLHGWWALCLALLSYDLATTAGIFCAVALSAGVPGHGYLKTLGLHLMLVLPLNAALGILAVTVTWTQRWAMLLLIGVGLAVALWYRTANTLRTRYADLRSLYGFTMKLSGLSEREEVLGVALEEARVLLHCRHAELYVPGDNAGTRYAVDAEGHLTSERLDPPAFALEVLTSTKPLLIPRGRRHTVLDERGSRT